MKPLIVKCSTRQAVSLEYIEGKAFYSNEGECKMYITQDRGAVTVAPETAEEELFCKSMGDELEAVLQVFNGQQVTVQLMQEMEQHVLEHLEIWMARMRNPDSLPQIDVPKGSHGLRKLDQECP